MYFSINTFEIIPLTLKSCNIGFSCFKIAMLFLLLGFRVKLDSKHAGEMFLIPL